MRNLPLGPMGISSRLTVYEGGLGLGLLGLATFAWLPDSYFRMVGWPWILLWQGAFLVIMAACFWRLRQFQQPFYALGFDGWVVGLYVGLAIISLGAEFPRLALQNLLLVSGYGILLYGLRNTCWRLQRLCQGVVWVGTIAAIISLILWRPTPEMWLSTNFYEAIRNRFPLGHHNFTGGYFVLVMPVAFGLAWMYRGGWRWLYGGFGLVMVTALYASGSRGAWLGGIVLLLLSLSYGIIRSRGWARVGAISFSGLALCLVLVLAGSNPRMRSLVLNFGNPLDATSPALASGLLKDGPATDRVFMAQAATNVIKHRPWGLGAGNLGRVYERYRPLTAGTGLSQVQQVHNTPLQLGVELGLVGALGYVALVVYLVKVTWQLQKYPSRQDRRLGLTVILAFLGYGISSLSDYQLENIPIATTLIILLACLSKLGGKTATLPQAIRRWSSVSMLMVVALIMQFWLRSDLALWFTHQGLASIGQGNLIQSDNKFYTAAALTPWDPTPSALGAQQLTEIALSATDENKAVLRKEAIELYKSALQSAPNDLWFNQNLAVLALQTGDVVTAHRAMAKVVQLSPRSKNHSYYLLGLTANALGDADAAVEAWALEWLINPQVVLFTSWYQDLAPFRDAVWVRALQHYQTILATLPSEHPLHGALQSHMQLLNWWFGGSQSSEGLIDRPLLQALLSAESNPRRAETVLGQCIMETSKDSAACRLLLTWLKSETLDEYLNTTELTVEEQDVLRSHIQANRTLKAWLQSTTQPVINSQRVALALLYRNDYAQRITSILLPDNLQTFSLPTSLNLFSLSWPRKFAPVDNLVEKVRAETLGLPHPTRNNFQITLPNS